MEHEIISNRDTNPLALNREDLLQSIRLVENVKFVSSKGWTPATSSNFSVRLSQHQQFAITQSGVDKNHLTLADLMVIDDQGKAVTPTSAKPSAETLLHTLLYEMEDVHSVFHTHSLNTTVLSLEVSENVIIFEGLEILKAFPGINTHKTTVKLPIFENSQDMVSLAEQIRSSINLRETWGFLLRGHGIYTWGSSIAQACKHLEAWETLCAIRLARKN